MWRGNTIRVVNTLAWIGKTLYAEARATPAVPGPPMVYNSKKTESDEGPKIEGAYVARCLLGLELLCAIFALDVNSLYPTMMRLFNLCHSQMIVYTHIVGGRLKPDYVRMWQDVERVGYANVDEISFNYNSEPYTFFTIKHRGDVSKYGCVPLMVKSIFERRIVKKVAAKRLTDFSNELNASLKAEAKESLDSVLTRWDAICAGTYIDPITGQKVAIKLAVVRDQIKAYIDMFRADAGAAPREADYISFIAALARADEQAMKLLMNATYGTLGARFTSLFSIYLASAVTAMGQATIRAAQAEAVKQGFVIVYGDTDSMYVKRPAEFWSTQIEALRAKEAAIRGDLDTSDPAVNTWMMEQLRLARRAYYEAVIPLAIKDAAWLEKHINVFFEERHDGQTLITFAYEEAMLPAMFFSKKVYAGLMHGSKAELDTRLAHVVGDLFGKLVLTKGLDMVKQGFSQSVTDSTLNMLAKLMDPLSDENIMGFEPARVVEDELKRIIEHDDWSDYERYGLTATFKKAKRNVPVQEFVARLVARNDPAVPADGEKFFYVVTQVQTASHNIYGRRVEVRTSMKWELKDVAKERMIPLDRRYYIETKLGSTLRKLTGYLFEHLVAEGATDKQRSDTITKAADKYVSEILGRLLNETKEKHTDVRRYLKELVNGAAPDVRRVLESMFSSIERGIFKVYDDAPIMLAKHGVAEIPRAIFVDGMEPGWAERPGLGVVIEPQLALQDDVVTRARYAYESLTTSIEKSRRGLKGNQTSDPSPPFAADDIEAVLHFLNALEGIRERNFGVIACLATRSHELLGL